MRGAQGRRAGGQRVAGGVRASASASRITSGTGSTGVPIDRSTRPPGWAAARALAGSSRSQGNSGSRAETSGQLGTRHLSARSPAAAGGHEGRVLVDLADLGGAAGRAEVLEELVVRAGVVLPLLRHVVLVEDRLDRADRLTGTAVDALVGVDVEHPVALVDAVDRALLDACLVEHIHARLGDDVGHRSSPPNEPQATISAPCQPSISARPKGGARSCSDDAGRVISDTGSWSGGGSATQGRSACSDRPARETDRPRRAAHVVRPDAGGEQLVARCRGDRGQAGPAPAAAPRRDGRPGAGRRPRPGRRRSATARRLAAAGGAGLDQPGQLGAAGRRPGPPAGRGGRRRRGAGTPNAAQPAHHRPAAGPARRRRPTWPAAAGCARPPVLVHGRTARPADSQAVRKDR